MTPSYNIQQRLLASANTPTGPDIGSILRRLLLFETVILYSNRLQEITAFVQTLGLEQTLALLASGALRIHCYQQAVAQTGQNAIARADQKSALPLGSYCITTMQTADQLHHMSRCFQELQTAHPLPTKQHIKLKHAILAAMEIPPASISDDTRAQFRADLVSATPLFVKAITRAVHEELGTTAIPALTLTIHLLDDEDFRVETNLEESFGLDVQRAHAIVERAVLSVGALNFRIAQMKGFTALAGFQDGDVPLFENKLGFLTQTFDPARQEERFGRVVTLLGLPDIASAGTVRRVDIEQFLKLRESQESRQFRAWLSTIGSASDADITDQVGNLRARLGTTVNLPLTKSIRFLVTTGVGTIPVIGTGLGVVAGILDTFILSKLFPESPIVTFLSAKYPALFHPDK